MNHSPSGGKLGVAVGKLVGRGAESELQEGPYILKALRETGRAPDEIKASNREAGVCDVHTSRWSGWRGGAVP
jgi:hypothetical protein